MCVLPVVCNNKVLNEVGDVSQSLSQEFKWNWHYGAFNNYVDQILPNFDPLPPRVDKDMDILHTIYPLSRHILWTFYWPQNPLLLST